MLTMQEALARLSAYWLGHGCLTVQPMNTEVGAGTMNPATLLRVLGPEPWRVAYVEPSVRPDDARYGENPNRIQCHTQFQVILKPEPGNAQELFLGSLVALGVDVDAHDVRFVEDNWASPALGAWGLGWEVWLDGLEITQFTYFQQAGGVNLAPVSVEITYGVERILMALQGVTHFKDIEYAPGVTYGEVFGQAEYEMSRYYLDDADVTTNRELLSLYAAEAERMLAKGLPLPAYSYVLKCSHTFNVLDARGAVSTAERAREFARMRRLAGAVAALYSDKRAEAGHVLGVSPSPEPAVAAATPPLRDVPRRFVLEIGTEELPPAQARLAADQVRELLARRLAATGLEHGEIDVASTPRRIVAAVAAVAPREPDHDRTVKGPRVSAAFDATGEPTGAARGFARSQHRDVADLVRVEIGGVEHLAVITREQGRPAAEVLAEVVAGVVGDLRAGKNMRWLDPELAYSRPLRWLLALLGDDVVPAAISTLAAGRHTRGHRDVEGTRLSVASAETFEDVIAGAGIVLSPQERRARIVAEATRLAVEVGGHVDLDGEAALLEQVVYLVEEPTPLLGHFAERFLELPEAVLATVMRKHQRYLPVRDAEGRLLPCFVAVANGDVDADVVRAGNESVLRARYEDAAFFYRADAGDDPAVMRQRLARLTFTDKLGSMLDRAERIDGLAGDLADALVVDGGERRTLDRARSLVKFDLASHMVVELTSLAGIMARDYALRAGETPEVSQALFESELPRQAGDQLPASLPGALLALADKLDLLVGLAATVGLPTGSSDPFAVRRAALGVLALHRGTPALRQLDLAEALDLAARRQPVPVTDEVLAGIREFLTRRLEQQLTEEGRPVDRVRAVLVHAMRPGHADVLLGQLDDLVSESSFQRLAAALQRARRIVPPEIDGLVEDHHLVEPAEKRLASVVTSVQSRLGSEGDLQTFVQAARDVVDPVEAFFDEIFVMVEDEQLRAARLGLLAGVRDLGEGRLDWQELRV